TATRHVNTSWCFACLRSGGLSGCQRCPASCHIACLPDSPSAAPAVAPFTCAPCRLSWQPRCGDIVWVKVGPFRWWPCEILLAQHAPENIQRLGRQLGTFPVRFFGTDEYYWVSLARLFPFKDGDLGESAAAAAGSAGTETAELMDKFNEGVALAQEAWRLSLLGELSAVPQPVSADSDQPLPPAPTGQEPQLQQAEASASSLMAKCDCQRRGRHCGELDGCANRLAGIECHPAACGPGCLNQRLSRFGWLIGAV
uniref:PWWP domain-containing protein n=1 Tax=Macrostomum lignano TaxID=282301 RepID=A0A1I8G940_9PLAT